MEFTVYILESLAYKRRYIGYSFDVHKRIKEHNEGLNISTSKRGPWKLIYREDGFHTRKEALKREKELKQMKGGVQLKALIRNAGIV